MPFDLSLCPMRIIAGILLIGVMLQTCSKQLIYTDYLLHKDFIASVLCINKNSPGKHCMGKCHLKKQLDQDTKQQGGSEQKSKPALEIFYVEPGSLTLALQPVTHSVRHFLYTMYFPESIKGTVFHPPSLLSA